MTARRGPARPRRCDALRSRGGLPVRLRAWDGSEAGPADAPVVVLRSRRALRRLLWQPGELGLAQAYVTGELDVDGRPRRRRCARSGARRATRASGPARVRPGDCGRRRGAPRCGSARSGAAPAGARRPTRPAARPAAQHRPRPGRDQPPLRPVQRVLRAAPRRRRWPTPAATGPARRPGVRPGGRAARQARPDLPQARPAARRCGCSTSAAAGARCRCTRRASTTARRSPASRSSARAAGLRRTRGSPSAAWRTWSRSGCRTTARCPSDGGRFDAVASIEMGEHVGERELPGLRRACCTRCCGPAAGC